MIFIFGGAAQGKLKFAKTFSHGAVCDFEVEENYDADIFYNVQCGNLQYLQENISLFADKIIVGTEIGCGVVPIDVAQRTLRDQVGFLYQRLSTEAVSVYRVWCGLPQKLK